MKVIKNVLSFLIPLLTVLAIFAFLYVMLLVGFSLGMTM